MNVFQRFLSNCGERRKVEEIPSVELDGLLSNFYITVEKKDNTEYEPDTLPSMSRSIQRHLDDKNARVNILQDEVFKVSREVLKSKRRQLRKQGKGNKPNATEVLTNEDVERIFDENQFGIHDPDVLSRTMWFLLTLHFGHRARHEARQMKFGDDILFNLKKRWSEWWRVPRVDNWKGKQDPPRRWKRASKIRFRPKAYETGDRKCPVSCFKEFVYRRPGEAKPSWLYATGENQKTKFGSETVGLARTKSVNFFQAPRRNCHCRKAGNFTNNSVRKTCIKTLLDSGVSHNSVVQLSGHKCLKSLDSYAVASHQQQREMSKILSGNENSKPKQQKAPERNLQNQFVGSTTQESI